MATERGHPRAWLVPRVGPLVLALAGILLPACREHPAAPLGGARVERARAPSGADVRWNREEILFEPVVPPDSTGVTPADFVAALTVEAEAWNTALEPCHAPRLRVGDLRNAGGAREDGRNLVVVRADRWCPADGAAFGCYEASREAITHVRPSLDREGEHAGEIREADIEINAVGFRWSPNGEVAGTRSLRAVLGHELGHALGLTHSCSSRRGAPELLDSVTLAACAPATSASIMYPDPTEPGRPPVFVPGADAVAGLCRAPGPGTDRP